VLERLWNGWRADYVVHGQGAQKKSNKSVFTQILNSGMSDEQCYIVHRAEKVFALMNAFPYTSGHLLVVPYREVAELEDLTHDETSELWATVTDAVKVLKYKPEAMNVGINLGAAAGGSIAQHLHVHIVGRWGGDTNFMVTTANTKILPEALDVSADRIRKAWAQN
jgi:ATP adenylyltransferase